MGVLFVIGYQYLCDIMSFIYVEDGIRVGYENQAVVLIDTKNKLALNATAVNGKIICINLEFLKTLVETQIKNSAVDFFAAGKLLAFLNKELKPKSEKDSQEMAKALLQLWAGKSGCNSGDDFGHDPSVC